MAKQNGFARIDNTSAISLAEIPEMPPDALRDAIAQALGDNAVRILAFFAMPSEPEHVEDLPHRIVAVLGDASTHRILVATARVADAYASFTPQIPALHWFEREIAEQYGIVPTGHPWLKPIRFHKPRKGGLDAWSRPAGSKPEPGVTNYFEVAGDGVHEVAVGPVHAGVIEPGHFRFQCLGEDVHHLEISLGYQHRGIEEMLEGGPDARSIHFAETAAGDTTAASASTYAAVVEALSGKYASLDSTVLRRIMIELERLANHVGDLGALAGDVAYLPTQSYCGRIRGEYLNMTAEIAGNRFGRNVIVPSGMRGTLDSAMAINIRSWLVRVKADLDNALELLFEEPSVLDRFEHTGTVDAATARAIGAVGVAARASGLAIDARRDFAGDDESDATFHFPDPAMPDATFTGDVLARARIRRQEIEASHAWLYKTLEQVSKKPLADIAPSHELQLAPSSLAVAVTEAWRGELVHVAVTDITGRFARYKIVDPSFHNWFALALAMRGEQISNFPICNKSFNLSYCGHDL